MKVDFNPLDTKKQKSDFDKDNKFIMHVAKTIKNYCRCKEIVSEGIYKFI